MKNMHQLLRPNHLEVLQGIDAQFFHYNLLLLLCIHRFKYFKVSKSFSFYSFIFVGIFGKLLIDLESYPCIDLKALRLNISETRSSSRSAKLKMYIIQLGLNGFESKELIKCLKLQVLCNLMAQTFNISIKCIQLQVVKII